LIHPHLLDNAGRLVEHYDRWLVEFYRLWGEEKPDLDTTFVFGAQKDFPFRVMQKRNSVMNFERCGQNCIEQQETVSNGNGAAIIVVR
jgi:hypothetical protein